MWNKNTLFWDPHSPPKVSRKSGTMLNENIHSKHDGRYPVGNRTHGGGGGVRVKALLDLLCFARPQRAVENKQRVLDTTQPLKGWTVEGAYRCGGGLNPDAAEPVVSNVCKAPPPGHLVSPHALLCVRMFLCWASLWCARTGL